MGKFVCKKAIPALLALTLLISASWQGLASRALGEDLHTADLALGEGVRLTRAAFWSTTLTDLRQEQYVSYRPNGTVTPLLSYGGTVMGTRTLGVLAAELESAGLRAVAGINGDFFDTGTGIPIGIVVTDGVLRSSAPDYTVAVGFRPDGSAMIGAPNLAVRASWGGGGAAVASVNKARSASGITLFTSDFSATTRNTAPGVDVILSVPQDARLALGGAVTAVVEQVLESTGAIPLEPGRFVLSLNASGSAEELSLLRALQAGQAVTLSVSAAPGWEQVQTAMGALYRLVQNGAAVPNSGTESAPRTAVGIKADGTVILYTLDGRQSGYSRGATLAQLGERLAELGCVEAICLDGGGSTTMGATLPAQTAMTITNQPSDGSPRAVTNALFLVARAPKSEAGPAAGLHIPQNGTLLLAGATLPLSAAAVDAALRPAAYNGAVSYQASGAGSVNGTVFTAGAAAGTASVTAQAGSLSGTAGLTVVNTVDTLKVHNKATGREISSLSVGPGDLVELYATADWRGFPLTAQENCFVWSVPETLGTISPDGVFTAGNRGGSGNLTVSAGGRTVTLPLSVAEAVTALEDFEGDFSDRVGDGDTVSAEAETFADYVRHGYRSLRVTYDLTELNAAVVPARIELPVTARNASLWVYGDGSGNELQLLLDCVSGPELTYPLGKLDFTGWRQMTASLPADAVGVAGFRAQRVGEVTAGAVWLDHFAVSGGGVLVDHAPPVLSASAEGTAYTARLEDAVDVTPALRDITLTYDGAVLAFTYDAYSGQLSATLPAPDGRAHVVTLTARDRSGNAARNTLLIAAAQRETPAFPDLSGHWAEEYAAYLFDRGIVTGAEENGQAVYRPDRAMTRAEFAVIMARWLNVNPEAYAEILLPFDDAEQIAPWALPSVKAMYARGVIRGSGENGKLFFRPASDISRAEAMTIIGRTLEQGYETPPLAYDDAGSVGEWARRYVETLTGMGVLSGYDGRILPADPLTRGAVAKILYLLS